MMPPLEFLFAPEETLGAMWAKGIPRSSRQFDEISRFFEEILDPAGKAQ
jgi:hypothetical protein